MRGQCPLRAGLRRHLPRRHAFLYAQRARLSGAVANRAALGTVVESTGRHGTVLMHESGVRMRCRLEKQQARRDACAREEHFVIGDRVTVAVPTGCLAAEPVPAVGQATAAVVVERQPRMRTLRRHLSAHNQRAIATAVDQLVLVTAVQPPPNSGLLDRFIVLAEAEGIDVVVVLNKVDLGGYALHKAQAVLAPYAAAGYGFHEISVSRGDGLPELRDRLASIPGQLSILAGHSGVGKSSLMNELVPDARLPTDELSRSRRGFRGRHMTTRRTCHLIPSMPNPLLSAQEDTRVHQAQTLTTCWPANSAMMVDTAGVRSFGLWGVQQSMLLDGFREFRKLSSNCRCVAYCDTCAHRSWSGSFPPSCLHAPSLGPRYLTCSLLAAAGKKSFIVNCTFIADTVIARTCTNQAAQYGLVCWLAQ